MSRLKAGINDLRTKSPDIAKEWDYSKNAPLTPEAVCNSSTMRVWWVCEHGHSWDATIDSRTSGMRKCPICSNQRVVSGYRNQLDALESEISELKKRRNNLNRTLAALEEGTAGGIMGNDMLTQQAQKYKDEIAAIDAQLPSLEARRTELIEAGGYLRDDDFLGSLGYATERLLAAGLDMGENITDFVGTNFYGLMEGVTSLGGLTPNPVSEWAGNAYDKFAENSVSRDYEESIRRRYKPTPEQEKTTGFGQTVAQVLLPIGAGKIVSGLSAAGSLAPAGTLATANAANTAKWATKAVFGTHAAGAAVEEAHAAGASHAQSLAYGWCVGAMETAIEEISGSVPGLPDGSKTANVVKKVFSDPRVHAVVSNPMVSRLIGSMGESGEEALSAIFTPYIKRAIYDPNAALVTEEEITEQALLGGLASLCIGAGIDIPTYVAASIHERNRLAVDEFDAETIQAIIDTGLESPTDTNSYKLAVELKRKQDAGKSLTAREVLGLYQENVSQVNKENAAEQESDPLLEAAREAVGAEPVSGDAGQAVRDVSRETDTQPVESENAVEGAQNAKQSTRSEELADEMTLDEAMAAFNGGGKYDVIDHQAVEQAVRTGTMPEAVEQADGATRHGVAVLKNYAEQAHMGKNGVKALGEFYDAIGNPELAPYYGAFAAYWNGGYNGKAFEEIALTNEEVISDVVKQAAYNAGKLDAIQELSQKNVEKAGGRAYNGAGNTQEAAQNKDAKKKTIRTKKSDWPSTDVQWTLPGDVKHPIAYSTQATSDSIDVMADEHPTATISQLHDLLPKYDVEERRVLQQYIDAGYGDQVANEWFSYDRKHGYTRPTTKWTSGVKDVATENKEATENGKAILGEVSDSGAVQQSGAGRQDAGGLLDTVASENVREDAPRGNVDPDLGAESGGAAGLARGDAASGIDGVRSAGVHQGGSVRTPAGGVNGQEVTENGRGQEAADIGSAETDDSVGSHAGSREGNAPERIESRIKEILRKSLPKRSKKPAHGTGRVESKETRDAFEDRVRADGYMYAEFAGGKLAVGFKIAPESKWNANAKAAAAKLQGWGIDVVVFDGQMHSNMKGVSDISTAAQTIRNAGNMTIFISADLDIDGMETAFHEGFHAAKFGLLLKYRMKIVDVIANGVNVDSANFETFVSYIADLYSYAESDVAPSAFEKEIIEEFYAWYIGKSHVATDDTMRLIMDGFSDVDSLKAQIDEIYDKMENGKGEALSGLKYDKGKETTEESHVQEEAQEAETAAEVEQKADLGNQEKPKGANFVIGEKGQKMPTTPKARYKANVDAIKTLRTIMAEGRMATPQEQEILAKYTGWGGLSDVFDERKTEWAKEFKQLKALLDDGEYKTAKGSILDAYYTDPAIIRGMYNGLAKLGFTGGRMLEPSAGVGRFIGAMPQEMLGGVRSWTAVELDKITGNIAKYLYPNADVRVQGYETSKIPDGYMDVVIGNVPFGNIPIADKAYPASVTKSIHNYFIAKSLDKLRPGGIAVVITSSGTLDAMGTEARSYFMKQADLIGAIRLPNTAFEGTGTSVVSDILVFKKRESGTAYKGEKFLDVGRKPWEGPNQWGSYEINEYFVNHPEMVLGTPAYGSGSYGRTVVTYNPLDSKLSLQKQIEKAFGKIKVKMDYPAQRTQEEIRAEIKAAGKLKQGTLVNKGGKLYENRDGTLVEASNIKQADTSKMSDILAIRDEARKLLDLQLDDGGEAAIKIARDNLNKLYDAFVKKYGYLNAPKNKKLVQLDPDSPFILALEEHNKDSGGRKKAAIFQKNTVTAIKTVTHADTVEEALTVSLNETGTVDVNRIAQLTGQQAAAVEREMLERGLAFKNRDGALETAEIYLSGNVRAKLRDAEALAEGDADYQRNVEALKKVIPADIPAEEIKVRPGATWIPDSVYSAFAGEMLGGVGMSWRNGQRVPAVEITYNRAVGKFFIEVNDPWLKNRPENTSTWGTPDRPFVGGQNSILDAALNNKMVSVYRTVGETRVLDKQATAAAQEKLEKVLAEFQSWIWKDETRRTELGGLYNDVFNNTVTPKYDGSHLTVNGSNPDMEMRPHQKNAVQRIINSGGNTLLAHRVGAGKTYEMAAAAMKLRQLGIVKKPLFIVPKHLVAQWANEFRSYFPAARILPAEHKDFTPANRKQFANRIAIGDYDAVIMSYEQFGMVPMSQSNQEAFYQEQIDALEMAILESKRASGKRDPSVRDMERSKKTFEAKLKKLGDGKKDADNIDFEQLGIDALFVDEAHNFKNLFYNTKMQGVADLGDKDGSLRAFDLYMKVRYLQRLNGGRGIVFATATPVMNSVVELYTMQRYLQGDLLDAKGLTNFDAWANQFGDVVTIRKMKTGGNGYELKQSLSRYKNLGEMQQMFRSFADVISDAADLPYLKIPKMKGGKRIVVECEPSAFQEQFMEELGKRAEALRGAGKGGSEDHIFKVFDDGKKISFTQRMIDSSLPYEDGGKIMKCAENVLDIWKRSKADKGTQLIFCDRGTPGGAEAVRGVSLYEDLKNLLVAGGVPANEIAFIHDATSEDAKDKLFKDVNEGTVRVLIGSTAKMGTGMNVQKRIIALHELNAPDRPGDLEQNEGRALRQGNMNDEVEVYAYVTKKTFDSRQWDNLKRKATFIHQIMAGEYNGREADGDGDLALSAAEISAIASDNPLIMEQFEVSEKIASLENLERAHTKEVAEAKRRIAAAEKQIESDTEYLERYKADQQARQETAGDKFRASIGGKTFTERKAAGEALIAAAKKALNLSAETETNTEIGSFAGFKLFVTSKGDMFLRGKAQYRGTINMQSPIGTIQTLEGLPKRIDGIIATTETRLAENKAAIGKLQKTAASSFDKADELIAARVREAEIMTELNPPSERDLAALADGEESAVDHDIAVDETAAEKRWTADRVGDDGKSPMRLSDIIEKIRHDFGINITTGHIRGKDIRGMYDQRSSGIRTKIAQDLPTVAHELGHHLDTVYEITSSEELSDAAKAELENGLTQETKDAYKKNKWQREGLAEFMRKYLQNRETAAIDYPEFTKFFMNALSGKDAALIKQLADEVNAYYSLDADTATSAIRLREEGTPDARTIGEKIKAKMSVVYQSWIDSLHGIKEFDKATGANTYKLASNAAYSDAVAGQIIAGDLTDANGQYVAPGLKTALHGLNLNDKNEYRLFGEYLTVKHGPERLAEGLRIFADDRKNSSAFMERRQAELEQQFPHFVEVSERLYDFQQQFLQTWGVETGLVSEESAKEWAERWSFYVPLNRAVSADKRGIGTKRGFANQNSTIKKARGSGLDVVHPVDNIINNIVKMVNAGVRNNVMRTITDSAMALGADATYMEKVPVPLVRRGFDMIGVKTQLTDWFEDSAMTTSDKDRAAGIVNNLDDILYQYGKGKAHGDVITVLKNGEQEFWKINDPQLLASVTTMSPKKMEGILDSYAVVSRFMTANITGNNVIWSMFSNFPRDIMTMFTYSKDKNPVKLFGAMGSAYINKAKNGLGKGIDPLYQEFLAMGGGKISAYTADRDLAKRARKKLSGKKFSANPLDWLSFASDTIELGPRFATYKVLRQNGMTAQEAFYEAMDVTVNFRRGGTVSRELNKIIPFFNASVQSLDKFRRWITAEDVSGAGRKKVVATRTISYIAVSAALAAIVYAINNGDDEDEENYEQLSNFTKNSYWCIPMGDGKYFCIPKPREIAVLSSFFETCMEYGIGENDHAFDEFYAYAADNFLPSVFSDVAKGDVAGAIGSLGIVGVGAYMMANRDFLGRPIVSAGLQNLEPKDQYTDRTSKIAYWAGRAFNASPQMVDYFFTSVLGGWWKYQKALFPVGGENVDFTLGVQNTYVKDNQYSTDLVNWMYDQADKSDKAKNSDSANIEKAITAKMDGNMTTFYSRYYALAKNTAETMASRSVRQTVLDMILEYQKATDAGTTTRAQAAVYEICERTKETKYLPGVMQSTIKDGNDREHTLSAVQYVEYQTDYLRLYWENVEENLYGTMTISEKVAVMNAAKTVAREEATARVLSRIGAKASDYAEKYRGVSADDVVDFLTGITLADADGSVKQAEVVEIITDMRLDDDDAWTLYFSKYDGKMAHAASENGISADLYMTTKIEMENIHADYRNGKEVRGSRRAKVERYLRSVTDTYKEYLFLLGCEYESVRDDRDYIMYFGKQD